MIERDTEKAEPKSANELILEKLRTEFEPMMARLAPEIEPAVTYNSLLEKTQ
jgi:hypothetical protein